MTSTDPVNTEDEDTIRVQSTPRINVSSLSLNVSSLSSSTFQVLAACNLPLPAGNGRLGAGRDSDGRLGPQSLNILFERTLG